MEEAAELVDVIDTLLNALFVDVLIADGEGKVVFVSQSFEDNYGVPIESVVGRTVTELESLGIFTPSITRLVMTTRNRQSAVQTTRSGQRLLVTGVPVFDRENRLVRIISYSYDLTELIELREHMQAMEEEMSRVKSELERLRERNVRVDGIVARSQAMQRVIDTALQVARHDVPILLLGESGVGKGVLAKVIHSHSPRSSGPFVSINCAAIPEALLESELFGYEQGAFTGAGRGGKPGLIELAHDGTLFLDEIGELPLSMQAKLLKVIQERRFFRIGGKNERFSNFRLLTATNQNIEEMVSKGTFRKDLYFRLNTVPIVIPPLRHRQEDIVELAQYFTRIMCERHRVERTLSPKVLRRFMEYDWPGNVRELENTIERLTVLSLNLVIDENDLPPHLLTHTRSEESAQVPGISLPDLLARYERKILEDACLRARSTNDLARMLGISQPTVVRKLHKHFGRSFQLAHHTESRGHRETP
ncbi:sigma-54 interaction domain-containing protein [Alicyclobacillus fructus]|uniref:sigma-54 interaction domain-containing protein n=1 Tax=Alicyclobacillus fructus TaxID=2816082 RepID=UPI001A8C9FA1|nr:sigma 54-interacting transcriptional regulator [Alicyclobacillus fructus]